MKKKKLEPIYSTDYYRMEKLVKDKRFQERVQWLHNEYTKLNHPIPQNGFKTFKQYVDWLKAFGKFYHEQHRVELEKALLPIKQDKSLTGLGRGISIVLEERRLLPLLPNPFVENLMQEFGLDKDNDKLFSFIQSHIFRGEQHLGEVTVKATLKRNDQGDWELSIAVLPHTKLKHITDIWSKVEEQQKFLPGYQGKNKPRETFERDLDIYNVYKEIRGKTTRKRAENRLGIDVLTYMQLTEQDKKRFEKLSLSQIRKAIFRIETLEI